MDTSTMKRMILATWLTILVSGCASSGITSSRAADKLKPEKEKMGALATKIYTFDSCKEVPTTESLVIATLASLFLKSAIEASIKGIGSSIKKAGEDKITTRKASIPDYFYKVEMTDNERLQPKLSLNIRCMVIVHGKLAGKGVDMELIKRNFVKKYEEVDFNNVEAYLNPANQNPPQNCNTDSPSDECSDPRSMVFSSDIRFFSKLKVVFSEDKTAMELIPTEVLVGAPFVGTKEKARDIVLSVDMKTPSQAGNGASFSLANMAFKTVENDTHKKGGELLSQRSGWMQIAPIAKSISAKLTANSKRRSDLINFSNKLKVVKDSINAGNLSEKELKAATKEKGLLTLSKTTLEKYLKEDDSITRTSPINLSASIIETQDGKEFLVKLGTFLSENSEKIAGPIFDAIDPITKGAAEIAAANSEDDARVKAIEAVTAFNDADKKKGAERSQSIVDVSRIKASQACRNLRNAGFDDLYCVGF